MWVSNLTKIKFTDWKYIFRPGEGWRVRRSARVLLLDVRPLQDTEGIQGPLFRNWAGKRHLYKVLLIDCITVGRTVRFDTRDPQFKLGHWPVLLRVPWVCTKDPIKLSYIACKIKEQEIKTWHVFIKKCFLISCYLIRMTSRAPSTPPTTNGSRSTSSSWRWSSTCRDVCGSSWRADSWSSSAKGRPTDWSRNPWRRGISWSRWVPKQIWSSQELVFNVTSATVQLNTG